MSQPKKPAPKPARAQKPAAKKPAPPAAKGGNPDRGDAKGKPAAKPAAKPAPKGQPKGGATQKGGAQKGGPHKSGQKQAQRKAVPSPAPSEGGSRLVAIVDGRPLGEAEARALWGEFSSYLEEHELDFAGFAASKGYKSIKPEHRAGRAVLVVESS